MKYIFPGTFDPITYGHLSIIKYINNMMNKTDKCIIAVAQSAIKKPILNLRQRIALIEEILIDEDLPENTQVQPIIGNVCQFFKKNPGICVRGIRDIKDLKYETYWTMSKVSKNPIEQFVFIPNFSQAHISSTEFKKQNVLTALNYAPKKVVEQFFNTKVGQQTSERLMDIKKIDNSLFEFKRHFFDYGLLNSIKIASYITKKLFLVIKEVSTYNLARKLLQNIENIIILNCREEEFFKNHGITHYFIDIREDTLRYEKTEQLFAFMAEFHKKNIDVILIKQEKFSYISDDVLSTLLAEWKEEKQSGEQEISNDIFKKYAPVH